MGQTLLKKEMFDNGIPVYSATIEDKPLGFIKEKTNKINLSFNDLVIPARGNSIGHVTLIKDTEASCTQTTIWMKLYLKDIVDYLVCYLKGYKNKLFIFSGGAIPQVTISMMQNYYLPLPPLEEQKRIIEKISEIDPYIEQYDKLEKQLTKLENEITDKLKKSILQYAIQGKLVKQDPNDEPASVLLERIKAEKEKLIKEGKIKRDKNESFIYQGDDKNYYENINGKVVNITDEIPFDIPDNWCWCRLKNVSVLNGGYAFKSEKFSSSGIRVVRISDFDEFGIVNKEIKRYPFSKEIEQYKIELGDILICMTGGTVGKSLLVEVIDESSFINQRIALVKPFILNNYYLNILIKSPYLLNIIASLKTSTNDNISMKTIEDFILPLSSLDEQTRIVNRIQLLFNYIK